MAHTQELSEGLDTQTTVRPPRTSPVSPRGQHVPLGATTALKSPFENLRPLRLPRKSLLSLPGAGGEGLVARLVREGTLGLCSTWHSPAAAKLSAQEGREPGTGCPQGMPAASSRRHTGWVGCKLRGRLTCTAWLSPTAERSRGRRGSGPATQTCRPAAQSCTTTSIPAMAQRGRVRAGKPRGA